MLLALALLTLTQWGVVPTADLIDDGQEEGYLPSRYSLVTHHTLG